MPDYMELKAHLHCNILCYPYLIKENRDLKKMDKKIYMKPFLSISSVNTTQHMGYTKAGAPLSLHVSVAGGKVTWVAAECCNCSPAVTLTAINIENGKLLPIINVHNADQNN